MSVYCREIYLYQKGYRYTYIRICVCVDKSLKYLFMCVYIVRCIFLLKGYIVHLACGGEYPGYMHVKMCNCAAGVRIAWGALFELGAASGTAWLAVMGLCVGILLVNIINAMSRGVSCWLFWIFLLYHQGQGPADAWLLAGVPWEHPQPGKCHTSLNVRQQCFHLRTHAEHVD